MNISNVQSIRRYIPLSDATELYIQVYLDNDTSKYISFTMPVTVEQFTKGMNELMKELVR